MTSEAIDVHQLGASLMLSMLYIWSVGKAITFLPYFINKRLSVQDVLVQLMSLLSTYQALGWADNGENVPHVCVY